jgi:hypothetical protein
LLRSKGKKRKSGSLWLRLPVNWPLPLFLWVVHCARLRLAGVWREALALAALLVRHRLQGKKNTQIA